MTYVGWLVGRRAGQRLQAGHGFLRLGGGR